jgi:hypothetical protein
MGRSEQTSEGDVGGMVVLDSIGGDLYGFAVEVGVVDWAAG